MGVEALCLDAEMDLPSCIVGGLQYTEASRK